MKPLKIQITVGYNSNEHYFKLLYTVFDQAEEMRKYGFRFNCGRVEIASAHQPQLVESSVDDIRIFIRGLVKERDNTSLEYRFYRSAKDLEKMLDDIYIAVLECNKSIGCLDTPPIITILDSAKALLS